ncbi:MFS transporter [Tumebacillus algifaecis]|uniref:MFS transporter n=1 Tax=Tumebacillus algifaecis TaxID=1214604 RepID=A0A223D2T9_9BACL|nr:DHA2 family efflux MFS transporter permease subunit [Tumebacillus algifaecis]ASS75851.1 MFS transporter [Tumebacillus algifaecis]
MSFWLNPKRIVPILYVVAMFMVAMDGTIVNVALRTISADFEVPTSASSTINVGYLVSLALVLPVAGWLGDRFCTKRMFLLAIGLFTAASALCGFANSLGALTCFRIMQGAAGGLLTPIGMAMLFRTFPPQERVKLSRYLVLPIALAPALGPILGGFLVDQFSWRWGFYVNIPVGILALLFGWFFLREHVEPTVGKLDLPGFLLSAPGFAMIVYALIQGSVRGWSSPEILGAGILGLLFITALIFVELRVSQPMLDLRLLRERLFQTTGLISLFIAAGLLGMLYVFPLMYQDVLHASALDAGMITFPEALGLMVSSQLVPLIYPRLGPRRQIILALSCAAATFVLLSWVGPASNPWIIRTMMFGAGFFLGQAVGAVQIASFSNIPGASMGRASTLFTVQNRLGSAMGLAVLATLLALVGTSTVDLSDVAQPNLTAYRVAMFGAAGFLLIGLLFAFRIRPTDAAATMRKQTPTGAAPVSSSNVKS